jgi:hypothetical protein
MLKIYFGRKPLGHCHDLDELFTCYLSANNYNLSKTTAKLLKSLIARELNTFDENLCAHTINPLIFFNMTDEQFLQYVYFIDNNGNEIHAGSDDEFSSPDEMYSIQVNLINNRRIFN